MLEVGTFPGTLDSASADILLSIDVKRRPRRVSIIANHYLTVCSYAIWSRPNDTAVQPSDPERKTRVAPVRPFRSIAHIPRAPDAHTGLLEHRIETTAAVVSILIGFSVGQRSFAIVEFGLHRRFPYSRDILEDLKPTWPLG